MCYFLIQSGSRKSCTLVSSKTRVAPLKALTIPRLELQAALLGVRLAKAVKKAHGLEFQREVYWSDSRDVLFWIKGENRRYKQFVSFRVTEIRENTSPADWKWVPGNLNIADVLTKWRISDPNIEDHGWFTGPSFLLEPEENWPSPINTDHVDETGEECKNVSLVQCNVESPGLPDPIRFHKFERLLRATAWSRRFIWNIKNKNQRRTSELTASELAAAERELLKAAQAEVYSQEISLISSNPEITLESSSPLYTYSPYLDEHGLLRMRSRIAKAPATAFDTTHPIILPKSSRIVYLLVDFCHREFLHAHNETVFNQLKQKFAIASCRTLIKKVRTNCQKCKNERVKASPPEMGELPEARLQSYVAPFHCVGIDYFGPYEVKVGRRLEKRWGVLFICFSTKAIHLEMASSLSTSSCIMCIRNFICRRGMPHEIYSDNGKNFIGAKNVLVRENIVLDEAKLLTEFPKIQWKFLPPLASHQAGLWERNIRSVKKCLQQMSLNPRPDDEALRTFLLEAENIVNSRPLTYVPADPQTNEAITPNDLLRPFAKRDIAFQFCDNPDNIRRCWKVSQILADQFWRRWCNEYLPDLARRTKWFKRTTPLTKGDIVVMYEDNRRNSWCKGIVEEVFPDKRGQVRYANIRTKTGLYKRPATKLGVLDVQREASE